MAQIGTSKPVALKVFDHSDSATRCRFYDAEVNASRAVSSLPGVVGLRGYGIHNLDQDTGYNPLPYIAMDYIQGITLRALISGRKSENRPITLPEVINIMMQICYGLEAIRQVRDAAGNDLVYADVKPENFMLEGFPQDLLNRPVDQINVKTLDLGALGILMAREKEDGDIASNYRKGSIIGTPTTLAPEVCFGNRPTIASDVYSCGILLYWLSSKTVPFDFTGISHLKGFEATAALIQKRTMEPLLPLPASLHLSGRRDEMQALINDMTRRDFARLRATNGRMHIDHPSYLEVAQRLEQVGA